MVKILDRIFSNPIKKTLPSKLRDFNWHKAQIVAAEVPGDRATLIKKNIILRDLADPDRFNHFLAYLYHPKRQSREKPVVILQTGMLCNGNLFRLTRQKGNFRDLDNPNSFANTLAFEGYPVIIPHPRYARWIYTRYVQEKLGIHNYFSPAVDFERLVGDLDFYIDAALGLTDSKNAVVIGFSMGGMELLNYLAFRNIDPRLAASILVGAPIQISGNKEALISILRWYGVLASKIPTESYPGLKLAAKNIVYFKKALRALSNQLSEDLNEKMLRWFPFADQLYNPEQVTPDFLLPLILYVLESMSSASLANLLNFVSTGDLVNFDTAEKTSSALSHRDIPQSLVISGGQDKIVSLDDQSKLVEVLGENLKEYQKIPQAGHLDLIAGYKSADVLESVLGFLEGIKN